MSNYVKYRALPEAKGYCKTLLSHEATLQLIDAVSKNKHLWNQNEETLISYDDVLKSWNSIIEFLYECGCYDADFAIDTWSNLYTAYFKQIHKKVFRSAKDKEYLDKLKEFITGEKEPEINYFGIARSDFENLPVIKLRFKKPPKIDKDQQQSPIQHSLGATPAPMSSAQLPALTNKVQQRAMPEARGFCKSLLSHEATLQLIESIRKNEHFWNKKNELYDSYNHVLVTWNTIIETLFENGCEDADFAIDTWSNLCTAYYTQLNKQVMMSLQDKEYFTEMGKFLTGDKEPEENSFGIAVADFDELPIIKKHFLKKTEPVLSDNVSQPKPFLNSYGHLTTMTPASASNPTNPNPYAPNPLFNLYPMSPYGALPAWPGISPSLFGAAPGYPGVMTSAPQASSILTNQAQATTVRPSEAQATTQPIPTQGVPVTSNPAPNMPNPAHPGVPSAAQLALWQQYMAYNQLLAQTNAYVMMQIQNQKNLQNPINPEKPLTASSNAVDLNSAPAAPVASEEALEEAPGLAPKVATTVPSTQAQIIASKPDVPQPKVNHVEVDTSEPLEIATKEKDISVEQEKYKLQRKVKKLSSRFDKLLGKKRQILRTTGISDEKKRAEVCAFNSSLDKQIDSMEDGMYELIRILRGNNYNVEEQRKEFLKLELEIDNFADSVDILKKMGKEATKDVRENEISEDIAGFAPAETIEKTAATRLLATKGATSTVPKQTTVPSEAEPLIQDSEINSEQNSTSEESESKYHDASDEPESSDSSNTLDILAILNELEQIDQKFETLRKEIRLPPAGFLTGEVARMRNITRQMFDLKNRKSLLIKDTPLDKIENTVTWNYRRNHIIIHIILILVIVFMYLYFTR